MRTAELLRRHPDRFLFGTDAPAPPDQAVYLKTYRAYEPFLLFMFKDGCEPIPVRPFLFLPGLWTVLSDKYFAGEICRSRALQQ
jgi:hypothetical protein